MSDAVAGAPTAPPAAGQVFGDRLGVLQAYADLLATAGVARGLIGPREAPRLWERHLLNCAGLSELLPPGTTVADLGAGAGLPGLVLAAARPDLRVVLVEPLLRRADFLAEAVALLDLPHATVRRARGEELAGDLVVDAVVARAVAPLEKLAGWALPLLRPGGRLLALKGERAQSELDEARPALTRLGGTGAELVTVGEEDLSTWARVVVIARGTHPGGGSAPAAAGRRPRPSSRSTTSCPPRDPGEGPARERPDRSTSAADRAPGSSAASRPPRSPARPDRPTQGDRTSSTARAPQTRVQQAPTPVTRPSARSRRAPSAAPRPTPTGSSTPPATPRAQDGPSTPSTPTTRRPA